MTSQNQELTTLQAGPFSATIASFGAQLVSLTLEGVEYLWQGDERWWKGQAPLLFPIVGRLRKNRAETKEGPTEMNQHGLARIMPWQQVEALEDSATYLLESNDDTLALFPFAFRLFATYRLDPKAGLAVTLRVENPAAVALPFCLGGHPAFNVPVSSASGETFNDYELRFTKPWSAQTPTLDKDHLWDWDSLTDVFVASDALPLTHRTFDVDTLLFSNVPDSQVALVGTKSGLGVETRFAGFDYLGVWSAAGDAPFVALEPWTGMATCSDETDEFEKKRGMVSLTSDESFERTFWIQPFSPTCPRKR